MKQPFLLRMSKAFYDVFSNLWLNFLYCDSLAHIACASLARPIKNNRASRRSQDVMKLVNPFTRPKKKKGRKTI